MGSLAKRIQAALQSDVDLDYPGTPAAFVVEDLKERFNMPMFVDIQATDVAGIGEKKIMVNLKQTPLFLGLHKIAAGHGLAFDYRFHSWWLTTPKAAAAWKDNTGVSDLKPAKGSPLAKALRPAEIHLLATPIAKLAEPLQKEYGLALDASAPLVPNGLDHRSLRSPSHGRFLSTTDSRACSTRRLPLPGRRGQADH